GGAVAAAAWMYVKTKGTHDAATAQATTAPPPVDLVAATAQGNGSDPITSLAPTSTGSGGPHVIVPTGTSAINPMPVTTTQTTPNAALSGMSYAQLAGQMSKSFQNGDGKTCLDAYDKMKGMPEFDANTWAMIHGYCLMEGGRCDDGRK